MLGHSKTYHTLINMIKSRIDSFLVYISPPKLHEYESQPY
jgi:hypothetical protein